MARLLAQARRHDPSQHSGVTALHVAAAAETDDSGEAVRRLLAADGEAAVDVNAALTADVEFEKSTTFSAGTTAYEIAVQKERWADAVIMADASHKALLASGGDVAKAIKQLQVLSDGPGVCV